MIFINYIGLIELSRLKNIDETQNIAKQLEKELTAKANKIVPNYRIVLLRVFAGLKKRILNFI